MIIDIYYKDPDAYEVYNDTMKKIHPDLQTYSSEFTEGREDYVKSMVESFGEVVNGREYLRISFDTDNREIIDINGNKYKLVK